MPSRYTRRSLLAGMATAGVAITAGCLGEDRTTARCSSRAQSGTGPLVEANPLAGEKRVALGILVEDGTAADEGVDAALVRDRDGNLVADVPLDDNHDMSRLDSEAYPKFDDGELYAVPLGPPPQHGTFSVEILGRNGTTLASGSVRFNCYDYDGDL